MSAMQVALAIGCVLTDSLMSAASFIPSGAGAIENVLSIVIGPLLASGT